MTFVLPGWGTLMRLPLPSRRRDRHRSRGQSLVELALIVPVFLLLMLTAIDLGRLLYSQITVTNAAKEGALVASQGGTFAANQPCSDANEVMCGVLTEADGGFVEVEQARVAITPATCVKDAMYPSTGSPPNVSVSVQAPFRVLTPIIGGIVGSNLLLTGTADAQCLVVPAVTYPSLPNPIAVFTANPTTITAGQSVSFNGLGSSSPGATITAYAWSFGASGSNVTRVFASPGSYSITLTVTDSRGQMDVSDPTVITVNPSSGPVCPTVSFTVANTNNPGNPHRVRFTGSVSDGTGGWTWTWTGPTVPAGTTGISPQVNFAASGPQVVTLTAVKASLPCTVSVTQTITAP